MTVLTVILAGLAFVVTHVPEANEPADPRWAAIATQQQEEFARTGGVIGAVSTATTTAGRTVPTPVALISTPTPTATPTLPPPTTAPVTPLATSTATPTPMAAATVTPTATSAATPTPTPPPSPTVTPEATARPAATASPEATPPPVEPTLPPSVLATVGVPVLNLRTGPGINFPIIAFLPRGTTVALLDGRVFADAYVWVEVAVDGRRGWLLGESVGVR